MANRQAVRAAAAVFVLGLSLAGPPGILCLAGPAGIAFADSGPIDRGPIDRGPNDTGPNDRGPNDTGQSHGAAISPQREVLPAKASGGSDPLRLPVSSQRTAPSVGSRSGPGRRGTPGPKPAALPAPKPAAPQASASRTSWRSQPAVARAADPATTSILAAAAVQEPSPAVAVAGAGAGDIAPASSPAAAPRAGVDPVRGFLNTVGQWLSHLPATPVTDLLSGGLWLIRRTLTSADSLVGSWAPKHCSCSGADPTAQALTVTSAVDGAPGSLRDVLRTASSGDVIRFAPKLRHANLVLTEGELDINVSVRIQGTGQTLDANGMSRIMVLDQPGTSISLSGLSFVDGFAPGDPTQATTGGAILAEGVTLNICGSNFIGNEAISAGAAESGSSFAQYGLGGAIAAYASTVSVSDSTFRYNRASGGNNDIHQQASGALGGAIFAQNSEVTLLRSQFTENSVSGGAGVTPIEDFPSSDGGWAAGGAVYTAGAALSVTKVTFTRNSATGGDGLDGSESNPFGNDVGAGGNATGGALWVQGVGQSQTYAVPLVLQQVVFRANTATGGTSGNQGSAFLSGQQGGRGNGGALGAVQWLEITMEDVTFEGNLAEGGAAGPNASGAGSNTETGGVAQGGAVFLDSPAFLVATRVSMRHNTARGGTGGNSTADSGTDAGEGGYSYGGAVLLTNSTGGLQEPVVIAVSIRDSELVGNRAVGGQPGTGPVPADGLGAGGLAQGGGLNMSSLFKTHLIGVRFVGNSAQASQGKFAAGGALINPFGEPPPDVDADLTIQNSFFRGNRAVGGDDGANATYRESQGGAFFNNGAAVISGSRFQGNSVIGGNDTGSGHVGSGSGGAIYNLGENPVLTISDSAFANNSALGGRRLTSGEPIDEPASGQGSGGAIASQNGTVTINGGGFSGNAAIVRTAGDRVASGGAIAVPEPVEGYVSYLVTTAVRFTSNLAASAAGPATGGAIAFSGSAFADTGSIFRGNQAKSGRRNGSAYGGALFLQAQSELVGSLVTHNRAHAADGYGGGVALPLGPDLLTEVQSTIRRNCATTAGDNRWWPTTAESSRLPDAAGVDV